MHEVKLMSFLNLKGVFSATTVLGGWTELFLHHAPDWFQDGHLSWLLIQDVSLRICLI